MKSIKELQHEALLEKKEMNELEKKRLVDYIEAAIKKGIIGYAGSQDLQVQVRVPGYHLYKKRGEAVFSDPLQEVLDDYALLDVEYSVDWTKLGVDKTEKSAFLVTVPARLLT